MNNMNMTAQTYMYTSKNLLKYQQTGTDINHGMIRSNELGFQLQTQWAHAGSLVL